MYRAERSGKTGWKAEPHRMVGLLLCQLLWLFPPGVLSQPRPDFSGVWEMEGWSAEAWDVEPPYTAAGRAAFAAWQADPLSDPAHQCIFNLVRVTSAPLPHEIIQQDDRVLLLYEYQHQVRRAWLDGKTHAGADYPTLMGYATASWEGNTLVIDTVAMTAGYLRPQGTPHSGSLRVIERRTMLEDGETKRLETIVIDPEYYSEPWSVTTQWRRTNAEILDYDCIPRPHLGDEQ